MEIRISATLPATTALDFVFRPEAAASLLGRFRLPKSAVARLQICSLTPCFTVHSPRSVRYGDHWLNCDSTSHALRQQNVPGIPAIHHSLRHVNAAAGDVGVGIHVRYPIHGAAMDSHA